MLDFCVKSFGVRRWRWPGVYVSPSTLPLVLFVSLLSGDVVGGIIESVPEYCPFALPFSLTLKEPSKTAADYIFILFIYFFLLLSFEGNKAWCFI